jgi:hypothetical protein
MEQLHGNAKPQSRWSIYNRKHCLKCNKLLYKGSVQNLCHKHKEKHHTEETKKKIAKAHIGLKHTFESKLKMSGSNSPSWRGGITPLNKSLRNNSLFKIWREAIFLRDNFTCQNPNCKFCDNKIGVFLHPHHIKSFALFPKLRFDVSNGITYCKEFHLNSGLHKNMEINYVR